MSPFWRSFGGERVRIFVSMTDLLYDADGCIDYNVTVLWPMSDFRPKFSKKLDNENFSIKGLLRR